MTSNTLIIYIVIYRQTCFVQSEFFIVARQARFPKLGSKPGRLKRQSKILLLSHEETSASEGNLNAYISQLFLFTFIRLTATESSIHMKSLALRLWQTIYFPRERAQPYYIVIHRQTCFVLLELFSVAKQARFRIETFNQQIYIYIYIGYEKM